MVLYHIVSLWKISFREFRFYILRLPSGIYIHMYITVHVHHTIVLDDSYIVRKIVMAVMQNSAKCNDNQNSNLCKTDMYIKYKRIHE